MRRGICEWLQRVVKERLDRFRTEFGKEPDSFIDLYIVSGISDIGQSLADSDSKTLTKALRGKYSLKLCFDYMCWAILEGIVFGGSFPELTEKMYRKWTAESLTCETRLAQYLSKERISPEEQEEIVLQMVAAYTSEYFPELVASLDLQKEVEEVEKGYKEIEMGSQREANYG